MGNPGVAFARSRHNVGFHAIDSIACRLGIRLRKPLFRSYLAGRGEYHGKSIYLAEPLTFMNDSGKALAGILKAGRSGIGDCVVVCDTLDLPPGVCRLKRKGSSAGHRGLSSIIEHSGTEEFPRVFIGIGHPGHKEDVRDYVLSAPREMERALLDSTTHRVAEALISLLDQPFETVLNRLNSSHAQA